MRKRKVLLALLAATAVAAGTAGPAAAQPTTAKQSADHSRLAQGTWFRIPVSKTGIYKVSPANLPALAGTPVERVAVCGTPGGPLSMDNSTPPPDDLTPCPIEVADLNGNGYFDAADYLLFYAEGASTWRYDPGDQRFEYRMNVYDTLNYYFITTTADFQVPRIAEAQPAPPAAKTVISTYTAVALLHDDKTNTHGTGQIWVGDKFSSAIRERSYTLTLPGIVSGSDILARYAFASISNAQAQFALKYNSDVRQHTIAAKSNYLVALESFTARTNTDITLTCTYTPHESNAAGYIDFIEFNAQAPLSFAGGQQTLRQSRSYGSGSSARFAASAGYCGDLRVWDVTDPANPLQLAPSADGSGFAYTASTEEPSTHICFTPGAAFAPAALQQVSNQDIHGAAPSRLVIVSHPLFLEQAERLADLHRLRDGMSALVVSQDEVFNEFSSGRRDPAAIRHMMRHFAHKAAATNSPDAGPRYLLLFGKGSYDQRNLLGYNLPTVVTYESKTSFDNEGSTYASDDLFGYLGDWETETSFDSLCLGIGRLPAKNTDEADHLVDKIQRYMEKSDLARSDIRGDWRNYVCLLADDADPSCPGDTNFTSSSEMTARNIKRLFPQMNIDRIYADAYVQQSGADGSYYPEANNALRQRINYGTLITNYVGHGSARYIGTERYMQLSDMAKYTNTDQLTFFVTSTCTFGRFDQPDETCGAEEFLLAPAAGIGVIAASRPITHIYSFNNDCVLLSLTPGNTVGDALRQAKNRTYSSRSITLLGDPALRLSIPQNEVVVTAVNGRPVQPDITDSAEVLSQVTITGEVRRPDGSLNSDFNGTVFPIVFDRETKCRTLANDNDSTEVNFTQQKSVLYKGRETVAGGRFSYSFIIPRDVAYRYDFAKLSHYARSDNDDATGQYGNIKFGGYNSAAEIVETFPVVKLFINDSNFRNGGLTNETPTLVARLSDSVGINAAGSGLGHDIVAVLDDNPHSIVNLNDAFEPDIQDSRCGTVRYTFGKLDDGPHSLTLRCWNIFNYSGTATISFCVANDRNAQIGQFASAPNPAHDRTTIRVEHNQPGSALSVRVDIYSLTGALVRHIDIEPPSGSCTATYDWDFSSDAGALVGRGVYAARAVITTADGTTLSKVAKIVRN